MTKVTPSVYTLIVAQALYFIATGIWPLVHARSFVKVTGPKVDFWLVKLAGLLISLMGMVLLFSGVRRRLPPETSLLAAGSAAALGAVDAAYVFKGRISPVYLLDALAEAAFLVGWGQLFYSTSKDRRRETG